MRNIGFATAWLAATVVGGLPGCKLNHPIDPGFQISQQPNEYRLSSGTGENDFPPTRLAPTGSFNASSSGAAQPEVVSSPAPSEPVVNKGPERSTSESAKPPVSLSLSDDSTTAGGDVPAEFSELLDAFRDSPVEVQQAALRQLIATAGQGVQKTEQPWDIAQALAHAARSMPELPDEAPVANEHPTRLASAPGRSQVDATVGEGPQSAAADMVEVAQAAVTTDSQRSAEVQPAAAVASANLSVPPTDNAELSEPTEQWEDLQLYQELVRRLASPRPGESDGDRYRREVMTRYLMVLAEDPDEAVTPIAGMTADEQEYLRNQLLALWTVIDPEGHPVAARRFTAAVPHVREAILRLGATAEKLDIRTLAFCTDIQSYGQIKRFDSDRFDPGQRVILYCELENFVARRTDAGFETHLQGSYEIFNSDGQKVAGQVLPADQQTCHHFLRDYFIAYQMHLPAQLASGSYRLELTMECVHGKKYGQASVPLEITKSRP